MKMKKTLTAVVAMALVAAVSVAGTLAYLTDKTDEVRNTFSVGSLGQGMKIDLWETKVKPDVDNQYIADETAGKPVKHNTYDAVMPNSDNYKDPYVTVENLGTEAYLFIEVQNYEQEKLHATVDGGVWEAIPDATPVNAGATVYAYKAGTVKPGDNLSHVNVLDRKHFTVDNFTNEDAKTLKFEPIIVNAYICQAAGFETAAQAWGAAFAPQA